MSNTGILSSPDVEILDAAGDPARGILLAVWERETPPDVQACIDAYDLERAFAGATEGAIEGHRYVTMSLRQVEDDGELDPLAGEMHLLLGEYNARAGRDIQDADLEIMAPGSDHYAYDLHRDDGRSGTMGIAVHRSGENPEGGHFRYVDRKGEPYLEPTDQMRTQFTTSSSSILNRLGIGAFGVMRHGLQDGLVHQATAIRRGYRWRLTFDGH